MGKVADNDSQAPDWQRELLAKNPEHWIRTAQCSGFRATIFPFNSLKQVWSNSEAMLWWNRELSAAQTTTWIFLADPSPQFASRVTGSIPVTSTRTLPISFL